MSGRQVVGVAQFVEPSSLEERVPTRPAQMAWRDERGAISAIAKHGAERRPGQPRILFRDVVEIELRIRGQQQGHQRVRASADVRVEVVEHEAAGRLGREVRGGVVRPAIQAGPPGRHRFQHDEDHIRRSTSALPDHVIPKSASARPQNARDGAIRSV